jgi:transposase-like protein
MPLRKWFLLIALMLNAKKSASAYQISRDLGIRRMTAWSMMHRARLAMATDQEQSDLLHGIIEADEVYIGGKPRKGNKRDGDIDTQNKRGRGTKKTPVIGITERLGRVIAKVAEADDLSAKGLLKFVCKFVDTDDSLVITDEYSGYNGLAAKMRHARINHSVQYADGLIHTNTIEGFWALVKRAWYGSHHHYSKKYIGLYIAEAAYKYNVRHQPETFAPMLAIMAA